MRLYMKQRLLSWTQDFDIYNIDQRPVFHVEGQLLSIGRKLRIYDSNTSQELAYVEQKLLTLLPQMDVYVKGSQVASIKQQLTLFKPRYEVSGPGWNIQGDIFAHDYKIYSQDGTTIANIRKQFLSWSDAFELEINEQAADPVLVIAVILAIDLAMDNNS